MARGRPELAPGPPFPPPPHIPQLLSPVIWAWSCDLGLGATSAAHGRYLLAGSSGPENEDGDCCTVSAWRAGGRLPYWSQPPGAPLFCLPLPLHRTLQDREPLSNTAPHQKPLEGLGLPPAQLPAAGPPGSSAVGPEAGGPLRSPPGPSGGMGCMARGRAWLAWAPDSHQHLLPGTAQAAHPAGENSAGISSPQPSEGAAPTQERAVQSSLTLVSGASSRALSSLWLVPGPSEGEVG